METTIICENARNSEPAVVALLVMLALFVATICIIIKLIVYCKICSKTGYCWALGLLMILPLGKIIMLLVLAFGDWPAARELRLLKEQRIREAYLIAPRATPGPIS